MTARTTRSVTQTFPTQLSDLTDAMSYCDLYLQLLLLGEPFDSLPGGGLAHEGHDPYERSVAVQHAGDFLHALPER